MRIGIDFGGVIASSPNHEIASCEDTGPLNMAQNGAFNGIREMVSQTHGAVWIVSKAGPRMQEKTRAWLETVNFFRLTGMDPSHLLFCLERPEKRPICRSLGITHFVDDRIHIMQILRGTVPNLFLYGPELCRSLCPVFARYVSSWNELMDKLFLSCRNPCCDGAQLIDSVMVELMCSDLCAKMGDCIPVDIAKKMIFGVVPRRGECIHYVEFNLAVPGDDLLSVPLPFRIDGSDEVILLNSDDFGALRTCFTKASSLFCEKKNWETRVLVAASNYEWAIAINEDGGVTYWSNRR